MIGSKSKTWIRLSLLLLALPCVCAPSCDNGGGRLPPRATMGSNRTPSVPTNRPTPAATPTTTPPPTTKGATPVDTTPAAGSDVKTLAEGGRVAVGEAFLFVARDAETYAALRGIVPNVPEQSAEFFRTNAVVAAFLGERRTGGYSVRVTRAQAGAPLRVSEQRPAKDAMLTQALTTPYQVVAVAVAPDQPLTFALDPAWQGRLRPYRITAGTAEVTGGFAGIKKKLALTGAFGVMRSAKFATFVFDVAGAGETNTRRALRDTATGLAQTDGSLHLARVDAFALSGAIESPLRLEGRFAANEDTLALTFQSVPAPHVSDNFTVSGQLDAVATAPARPNVGSPSRLDKEP